MVEVRVSEKRIYMYFPKGGGAMDASRTRNFVIAIAAPRPAPVAVSVSQLGRASTLSVFFFFVLSV